MDYFPRNQGLASSLQSFVQMVVFASMAGFVVPLLFDSSIKLAWGMVGAGTASLCCYLTFAALRRRQT